jgi:Fe-S cluster assembly iron-binding protein IscA
MNSRRFTCAGVLAFLSITGCSSNAPASRERPTPQNPWVAGNAEPIKADIRVTAAAKAQIAKIANRAGGTMVRLEFTPEGCTGMKTHLDIELDPLRPQDSFQDCDGLFCAFLTEQFPLVQGALIDWKEKEAGFTVTFPNKTRENQVKTTKWINDEAEKRLRRFDEQDRAAGRLTERIAEFRKFAADDPGNELAHYRLGQLLMTDNQHAEAVKCFERTLALSPDFSKSAQLLGECLIKLGQKERAVEVLTKGWTTADKRGDEVSRGAIGRLLVSLDAPIPQGVSSGGGKK